MSILGLGKEMIRQAVNKLKGDKPNTPAQGQPQRQGGFKKKAKKAAAPKGFYNGHPVHKLSPRIQRVLAEKERRRIS